jgi:predicted AAA+ superfamily ATPase
MPAEYWPRIVDDELDELLHDLAALAIEGAKGVGKTASAARRAATVRALDDPAQLALAAADPQRALDGPRPILLDEWQLAPFLWDQVRRAVDQGSAPGSYLLTGSTAPREQPAHSGAGRIARLRMRPMALAERHPGQPTVSLRALFEGDRPALSGATEARLSDYAEEIVASGFPGLRRLSPRPLRLQLDAYLSRVLERDFEEVGHRVRAPATLRRWMAAYAAATATTATYETIRHAATAGEGAAPSRATTQPYRDALERLFLLDPVPGWAPGSNRIARLALPPKHHLADPALAARLLDVGVDDLLEGRAVTPAVPRDGTLMGALFESLVTLSVRAYAQAAEATVAHLRTKGGDREVDLIVERGGRVVAIEVKLARVVRDADMRHLEWLAGRIGGDLADSLVITTGPEAYRRPDGIGVVPAVLLGP